MSSFPRISLALTLLLVAGCSGDTTDTVSRDDTRAIIYVAENIITMDEVRPQAKAVAVVDGHIAAVGNIAEVQRALGSVPFAIDKTFLGKTLLPGFIEPHLRPYLAGIVLPMEFITPHDWNLPGKTVRAVEGREAYLQRLQAVEAALPAGEWLYTWGYHPLYHGSLSRADLDAISRSRPIIVWHRSFHEIYANSAALQALGIEEAEVRQVEQADYDRGHFYENGMMLLLPALMPRLLAPERYIGALRQARTIIHAGGITTVGDGAFGTLDIDRELAALVEAGWDSRFNPFRTYLLLDGKTLGGQRGHDSVVKLVRFMPRRDMDRVKFARKAIKLFADGAAYSQLMQMRGGYTDGHEGEWLMTPEELEAAARIYWNAGFQIHVQVNGDRALDETLNILEKLQREKPRDNHRFTIHHLAYMAPDQALRLASLGAIVSANPYYVWALADKYAEHGLGPERAAYMVPSRALLEQEVKLAFHSDFTMAPAQPLLLAWAAVTRLTAEGNIAGPEQRISVTDALRAITINAAYQMRLENEIGSIEVGKKADFTVLEVSPYDVRPEQLKDIPIWGTVFEGELNPLAN